MERLISLLVALFALVLIVWIILFAICFLTSKILPAASGAQPFRVTRRRKAARRSVRAVSK